MLGIFITLFTFILILVSLFLMLVVLMQRANTNAGMGAAFGGGVADSAFGADTTNVLTRATKWAATAFFVIAAALYLMYIAQDAGDTPAESGLPEISVPETVPATEEAIPAPTAPSTETGEGAETAPLEPATEEAAPTGDAAAATETSVSEEPAATATDEATTTDEATATEGNAPAEDVE